MECKREESFNLYSYLCESVALQHSRKYENKQLQLEMKYPYIYERSNYAEEDQLDKYIKRNNLTLSDDKECIKTVIDDNLKKIYDSSSVVIRVTMTSLLKILRDKQIKNQFQTGTSRGLLNSSLRKSVENNIMSVPYDTLPENRPIYGMLFPPVDCSELEYLQNEILKGLGACYGDCLIVLNKEAIEPYITLTVGDSINHSKELVASDVKNLKYRTASYTALGKLYKLQKPNIFEYHSKAFLIDEYIEVQIHGIENHSLNVISEIIFPNEVYSSAVLYELYKKQIPYRVLSYEIKNEKYGKIV